MRFKNLQPLISIILSLVLFSGIVLGQEIYPPHKFYGNVIYNGQPAPDGVKVEAKIDGEVVVSTTTVDGKYGYDTPFYVEGSTGDEIYFFVNGIDSGRMEDFCNACYNDCGRYDSNCPSFDLSVSGPPIVTPTTEGGGGGGGGGSRETTTTTTIIVTQTTVRGCQEEWSCGDWSACENGMQTRTCTDANNCGSDLYKPFETQPCVKKEETIGITGSEILAQAPIVAGLIVILIIGILVWRKFF